MIKALRTFRVHPRLPAELQPLTDLAANLRWAWDQPTEELFRRELPDRRVPDALRNARVGLTL